MCARLYDNELAVCCFVVVVLVHKANFSSAKTKKNCSLVKNCAYFTLITNNFTTMIFPPPVAARKKNKLILSTDFALLLAETCFLFSFRVFFFFSRNSGL